MMKVILTSVLCFFSICTFANDTLAVNRLIIISVDTAVLPGYFVIDALVLKKKIQIINSNRELDYPLKELRHVLLRKINSVPHTGASFPIKKDKYYISNGRKIIYTFRRKDLYTIIKL